MRTIHKFTLRITDVQSLSLPRGAVPLSVQVQHDSPQMWALVNDETERGERLMFCCGTGHPAPADAQFVGTVQMGPLVWHFFLERDGLRAGLLELEKLALDAAAELTEDKIDSRRTGNGPGYNGGPGGCDADKTGIDSSDHDASAPSSAAPPNTVGASRPILRESLSDFEIDGIAETMPGGLDGFLKTWGWRQYARAVEAAVHGDTQPNQDES